MSYDIAFFGSSLTSAYWNGAATYYRGLLKNLARLGHRITFYEPDAFERQQHRDIEPPEWARVVVWQPDDASLERCLMEAASADFLVKASGIGVYDAALEQRIAELSSCDRVVLHWDVDAPATLAQIAAGDKPELARVLPQFDAVLTYGGGPPICQRYEAAGARRVVPVYNALDPETHHPVAPSDAFECELALMANRLPDREQRIAEFFFAAARRAPDCRFLLGGSGWDDYQFPSNVHYVGHVYTRDHNALNCSARAVLNVSRDSMASNGWSPATRVFEAAGAGACLITDRWLGLEQFLRPGAEVLVADSGADVAAIVRNLTPAAARAIGDAARRRVLEEHTYRQRAEQVDALLHELAGATEQHKEVV